MGWASGSEIADAVIEGARAAIPGDVEARKRLFRIVIPALEDADWDTQDECTGTDTAFDDVLAELHPDWDVQ